MVLSWCGDSIQATSNARRDGSHGTPSQEQAPALSIMVNEQVVCILLECILVISIVSIHRGLIVLDFAYLIRVGHCILPYKVMYIVDSEWFWTNWDILQQTCRSLCSFEAYIIFWMSQTVTWCLCVPLWSHYVVNGDNRFSKEFSFTAILCMCAKWQ